MDFIQSLLDISASPFLRHARADKKLNVVIRGRYGFANMTNAPSIRAQQCQVPHHVTEIKISKKRKLLFFLRHGTQLWRRQEA